MKVHQTNLSIDDETRVHGRTQGQVFLVADGISDGPTPSLASREAIDSVVHYFLNEMPWYHLSEGEPRDVTLALKDALRNAQEDLHLGRGHEERGVATTLTLAFVDWPDLYVAHLGRNRLYVRRDDSIRLLTTDHAPSSLAARTPEVQRFQLELGDVLALCSDGVSATCPPERIAKILGADQDAEWMCGELITADGPDDRTAIVVRFLPHERVAQPVTEQPSPDPLAAGKRRPRPEEPRITTPDEPSPSEVSRPGFLRAI